MKILASTALLSLLASCVGDMEQGQSEIAALPSSIIERDWRVDDSSVDGAYRITARGVTSGGIEDINVTIESDGADGVRFAMAVPVGYQMSEIAYASVLPDGTVWADELAGLGAEQLLATLRDDLEDAPAFDDGETEVGQAKRRLRIFVDNKVADAALICTIAIGAGLASRGSLPGLVATGILGYMCGIAIGEASARASGTPPPSGSGASNCGVVSAAGMCRENIAIFCDNGVPRFDNCNRPIREAGSPRECMESISTDSHASCR